MDEANGAFKALLPTFQAWTAYFFHFGGSDVQMPFYMPALWAWHKLGFTSEYGFRLINIPFLVIMVLTLRRFTFWPLVCLASPFVLYYVGELRPYTMQMAFGSLAALGLIRVTEGKTHPDGLSGMHTSFAACLLLSASSLSAAVFAPGIVAAMLIIRPDWLAKKSFWLKSIPWALGGIALGAYYTYTIIKGYGAVAMGGGLMSMAFGAYETMGLLGIGPDRDAIRENPQIITGSLPWLIPAAAIILAAWAFGVRIFLTHTASRERIAIITALAIPFAILAAASVIADFQVLGRHMSPAIPALLLPLAICLGNCTARKIPEILAASAAVLIFIASSLFLRLDPRHARPDYRSASELAIGLLREGKSVLWKADTNAPRYYAWLEGGMPLVNGIQVLESNPPSLLLADVIIVNRPELRYAGIDHKALFRSNYFKPVESSPAGFEVWSTQPLSSGSR